MTHFRLPLTVSLIFVRSCVHLNKPAVTSFIWSSSAQLGSALWSFHVKQFGAAKLSAACFNGMGSRIVHTQFSVTPYKTSVLCDLDRRDQNGEKRWCQTKVWVASRLNVNSWLTACDRNLMKNSSKQCAVCTENVNWNKVPDLLIIAKNLFTSIQASWITLDNCWPFLNFSYVWSF